MSEIRKQVMTQALQRIVKGTGIVFIGRMIEVFSKNIIYDLGV